MGVKMAFELGLHRKIKSKIKIDNEIKEMRDMAFWGCFAAETYILSINLIKCHVILKFVS